MLRSGVIFQLLGRLRFENIGRRRYQRLGWLDDGAAFAFGDDGPGLPEVHFVWFLGRYPQGSSFVDLGLPHAVVLGDLADLHEQFALVVVEGQAEHPEGLFFALGWGGPQRPTRQFDAAIQARLDSPADNRCQDRDRVTLTGRDGQGGAVAVGLEPGGLAVRKVFELLRGAGRRGARHHGPRIGHAGAHEHRPACTRGSERVWRSMKRSHVDDRAEDLLVTGCTPAGDLMTVPTPMGLSR